MNSTISADKNPVAKNRMSVLTHYRDILILPVTITIAIPYLLKNNNVTPGYIQ
jgi:hypothetical protein